MTTLKRHHILSFVWTASFSLFMLAFFNMTLLLHHTTNECQCLQQVLTGTPDHNGEFHFSSSTQRRTNGENRPFHPVEIFSKGNVKCPGTIQHPIATVRKPRKVTGKHGLSVQDLSKTVETPIIVMGMMKAGTTSIFGYFRCGLQKKDDFLLSHYDCKPDVANREKFNMPCGRRMWNNLHGHKDAFDGMDHFALYAELDAQTNTGGMMIPQYTMLEEIHQQFPTATWILNLRDPQKWVNSVNKWKDLRQRFIDVPFLPDLPKGKGSNDTELINFYLAQAQKVRDFVKEHPSHNLFEVHIEDPEAGQKMENWFGITQQCWGVRNTNHDGAANWKMLPDETQS